MDKIMVTGFSQCMRMGKKCDLSDFNYAMDAGAL